MHVVRQAFQRNVLAQTAHLLPPRKLRPHFLRLDSRVHPGDKKVIEHVGAFGDEAGMIPGHRFDQAFDKFFAELLDHLGVPLARSRAEWLTAALTPFRLSMIVQSRLSTSGLAARPGVLRDKPSEGSCPLASLLRAEAISAFEGGLRDFAAAPFLPARGVGASVFFVALAMLRPYAKKGRYWVAPIRRMQRNSSAQPLS